MNFKSTCQSKVVPTQLPTVHRTSEFIANDHELWCKLARAQAERSHYSEALVNYDRALALKPDNHKAWVWRGGVLTYLDRYKEALVSFEKALEIESNDQTAWLFKGMALHHLGQYKKAYACYDKVLGVEQQSTWQRLMKLFKQ